MTNLYSLNAVSRWKIKVLPLPWLPFTEPSHFTHALAFVVYLLEILKIGIAYYYYIVIAVLFRIST